MPLRFGQIICDYNMVFSIILVLFNKLFVLSDVNVCRSCSCLCQMNQYQLNIRYWNTFLIRIFQKGTRRKKIVSYSISNYLCLISLQKHLRGSDILLNLPLFGTQIHYLTREELWSLKPRQWICGSVRVTCMHLLPTIPLLQIQKTMVVKLYTY